MRAIKSRQKRVEARNERKRKEETKTLAMLLEAEKRGTAAEKLRREPAEWERQAEDIKVCHDQGHTVKNAHILVLTT